MTGARCACEAGSVQRAVVILSVVALPMAVFSASARGSTPAVPARLVFSGTTRDLSAIAFAPGSRGLAVGAGGTVLETRNAGRAWKPGSSGTTLNLAAVSFPHPRAAYIAGGQSVLGSLDAGKTWRPQKNPMSGAPSSSLLSKATLNAVSFAGRENGVAVGNDGVVIATSDGGENWSFHGDPAFGALTDVALTGRRRGFAVGIVSYSSPPFAYEGGPPGPGSSHRILAALLTTDGGKTWTARESHFGAGLLAVSFPTANLGFAAGSSGKILATSDGGRTWRLQRKSNSEDIYGIAFADEKTGVASGVVTSGAGRGRGVILTTSDGGRTWTPRTIGAGQLRRIAFADPETAYAVGARGRIVEIKLPSSARNGPASPGPPLSRRLAAGLAGIAAITAVVLLRRRGNVQDRPVRPTIRDSSA